MEIIDYSDKSLAIIGESTKLHKEALQELGAKYNPNLTVNEKPTKGWIISKKKQEKIEKFVRKQNRRDKKENDGDDGKDGKKLKKEKTVRFSDETDDTQKSEEFQEKTKKLDSDKPVVSQQSAQAQQSNQTSTYIMPLQTKLARDFFIAYQKETDEIVRRRSRQDCWQIINFFVIEQ